LPGFIVEKARHAVQASSCAGHPAGKTFEDDMPGTRGSIFLGVVAVMLAASAGADSLPASVRACIGEADATLRLACYDREVARLIAPAGTFAPAAGAVTAPAATVTPVTSATLPAAVPPVEPSRHLSAKVSAVRQSGDNLIVTLDTGGVWEQSAPATSQLNLRPGDTVQLDRELGGWFLSNRYGDSIQVRLRQP
jgi:hypothetical protein